jgi:hypothetical protein
MTALAGMGELLRNRRVVCPRSHRSAVCRHYPHRRQADRTRSGQAGDAFATPTIVHFGAVLLLSAAASAPWHGVPAPRSFGAYWALSGIVYEIIVARRMRKAKPLYAPV